MRDLSKFSAKDWLRAQPLIEGGKQLRNDFLQKGFLKTRPAGWEKFLQDHGHLKGKNILQMVAFEQPEVLSLAVRMATLYLADATLLVFDNSRRPESRIRNARVCRENSVSYLALPPNPTSHANRSHGMAMTWIWHNIVKLLQPAVSGFIDHDLILLEQTSPGRMLNGQPFYGLPNVSKSGWGWSLWAGYCLYNFAAVGGLPLNFLNDFSRGLDTGGRNWKCLYRTHDEHRLEFARLQVFDAASVPTRVPQRLEILDGRWLHIARVSHEDDKPRDRDLYGRITSAVEQGADWPHLQAILGGPENVRPTSKDVILQSPIRRWRLSLESDYRWQHMFS